MSLETEKLEYRNKSNLSYVDCCIRLVDDSRPFEEMSDEDLDVIYFVAFRRWAFHMTRYGYIESLYKERAKRVGA